MLVRLIRLSHALKRNLLMGDFSFWRYFRKKLTKPAPWPWFSLAPKSLGKALHGANRRQLCLLFSNPIFRHNGNKAFN